MLSKEEIEKAKEIVYPLSIGDFVTWFTTNGVIEVELAIETLFEYIKQLETEKQKLIKKLKERIKSVEKCYQDLIKSYYDEKLNIINTSSMNKKEKTEFINKKNCLSVQKHCYEEILEILKGENG